MILERYNRQYRRRARRRQGAASAALLVTALVLACSASTEPPPAADPSSRRILAQGEVVGFSHAERDAHVWRGLPFARPPVGALRWRAPRPPEPWTGVREALAPGSACPQFELTDPEQTIGSEDCLYLDVYAPRFAPAAVPRGEHRLPVLVWLHGGGNTMGEGSVYDGSPLAAGEQLVFVTLNYRLGVFGWFAHPALRAAAESPDDASGNFGTLDIIHALEWVRENVATFGGDPGRVTVFGESAGGSNAFSLLLSPRARGLFHGAIAQSGGLESVSTAEAESYTDAAPPGAPGSSGEVLLRLLERAGRAGGREQAKAVAARMTPAEALEFLRGREASELLRVFEGRLFGSLYQAPAIFRDGHVILDGEPLAIFREGRHNAVPVILGANREESKTFLAFGGSPHVRRLFQFPIGLRDERRYDLMGEYGGLVWKAQGVDEPAAALRAGQGAGVFGYRFDWDEEPSLLWLDLGKLLGAAHGVELLFVFGLTDLGWWNRVLYQDVDSAAQLSRQIRSYWAEFAHRGDPGRGRAGALPRWQPWGLRAEEPRFLLLDSPRDGGLRMSSDAGVSVREVVERVAADPRFQSAEERCEVYRSFVQGSRVLAPDDYASIEGGACRRFPLEARTPTG